MDRISALGELEPLEHGKHDGPATRYRLKGAMGEIGFIRPLIHHFCDTCSRLRLTASGKLRACLLSDYQVDLKEEIRSNCTDETIARIFKKAARHKPRSHQLDDPHPTPVSEKMSAIGG